MRQQPPPLRFLALVLGLWVGGRAAQLVPGWWVEQGAAAPAAAAVAPKPVRQRPLPGASEEAFAAPYRRLPERWPNARTVALRASNPTLVARVEPFASLAIGTPRPQVIPLPPAQPPLAVRRGASAGRWSGSAWLLLRDDAQPTLAPGGTPGGSQSGIRFVYRLNRDPARPLALSARLYTPLRDRSGAEAALGLDWRPLASVPVHVLAERRQALGRNGRSAFALALHGGVADRLLLGPVTLDAYGQAGVVGTRSRDLFVDGAARVSVPAAGIRIGAGLWGGAQPGAARLDAGPQASVRVPIAGEAVRISAEWRFRIAGDARPGSGPVITVGSDF